MEKTSHRVIDLPHIEQAQIDLLPNEVVDSARDLVADYRFRHPFSG